MLHRTLRPDRGQIGPAVAAFTARKVAFDAALFPEEHRAVRRIAWWLICAAALAERPHVRYQMGDLNRREEDTRHSRARYAVGDVTHQIAVRTSVEEDASGEVRAAATLPFQSVALRAVRTKYLRAGGDMVLTAEGARGSEQHHG